ncbi:MAG: hypothetical protein D4S01_10500 [Dehalococcoidia bacterium]|nr:MAG: hypothetical protein D4S01_10500 [Dehalococcoidia bacterium]
MTQVNFITQTYTHRSADVSVCRTLNMYPEDVGNDSKGATKTNIILIGTPGTAVSTDLSTLTDKGCRGLHTTATGRLFGVWGGSLIEIKADKTAIKVADVSDLEDNPVEFADDGVSLLFVDGFSLRGYNLETGSLSNPTLWDDSYKPKHIQYLAARFIIVDGTSNQYYWSNIANGYSWPALNFASAERSADNILNIKVTNNELWLIGPRSYEIHSISPNPDRPYVFAAGSSNDVGCAAEFSLSSIGDNVFWLGGSTAGTNSVYVSNGYRASRISTHAIEFEIDKLPTTGDGRAFTYQEEGHMFYILSFPIGGKTFVYDLATAMWHERSTRDSNFNTFNVWSPKYATNAFNETYVGNETSNVLELKLDKYEEWDGRPIVRIHQSPIYWNENNLNFHKEFQVDMETGVGINAGQGSEPKLMMEFSDDSGHTWSSEYWTEIGAIGNYGARARFRRLGKARFRVYRVTISDPIKIVFTGAKIITEKGIR